MDELKLKCLKRKKETMFVLKGKKGFAHHTIKFTFFSKVLSKPLEGDVKVKKKSTDLANILLALTKNT